jgi:hypothetical protein
VLFSSAESGASLFVGTGFKRRLGPVPIGGGFVLVGTAGAGTLTDRTLRGAAGLRVDHISTQASLLAGYEWHLPNGVMAALAGAEADFRQALVGGAATERAEPRFGLRLQGEAWLRPTEATLATLTVVLGSARPHAWARASWGYKVWRELHLGPEAAVAFEPDHAEARLGVHATGLRLGRFDLRLSGGVRLAGAGDASSFYAAIATHVGL